MRTAVALLLLIAGPAAADDKIKELAQRWPALKRDGKVSGLMLLGGRQSADLLRQCERWLKDKDPVVRGHVMRVVAGHVPDPQLRKKAEQVVETYVRKQLAARQKREDREFKAIHRKLKRKLPPADQMAAGSKWTDPYDEQRRKLPEEIKEERLHMKLVIAAIESARSPVLRKALLAIFNEHHDPEVLVRAVECFEAWKDYKALVPMADLLRIQQMGREMGGSHVIGEKRWNELRYKWDVYKDEIWWSRPEYVPRTIRPVCKAASAITGAQITSTRSLDGWMLDHEELLRQRGVTLSGAFVRRAETTQK